MNLTTYKDQTRVFFEDPSSYLKKYFPPSVDPAFPPSRYPHSIPGVTIQGDEDHWNHEWPKFLVIFGALLHRPEVGKTLLDLGYMEVWRAGREWEGEGGRKGGVRVWKYDPMIS